MQNYDFILKSGEKLHISTPEFEESAKLIETVKKVTTGMDPKLSVDDVIFADENIRKALYPCFKYAMYGVHQMSVALMNDPKMAMKVRGDYFEIGSRIIEVVSNPFFLNHSSESTTPAAIQRESPELP